MWQVDIVEAEPVQIGDRELTLVSRVETHVRRRALVGTNRLAAECQGTVVVRPIAIRERSRTGERDIPVRDAGRRALTLLALVVVLAPLLVLEAGRQGIVPVEIGQRLEIRLVDDTVAGIAARGCGWWPLRGLFFLAQELVQKAHVDSSSRVL